MPMTPSPRPSPFEGEGVAGEPNKPVGKGEGNRPVGEVVQASTTEFVVQCHRLYDAPALGSLLKNGGDSPIYGIVGQITTQSVYPGRRPTAIGEHEGTVEAVYQSNPQLSRLLSTDVHSIVVGYQEGGRLHRYLAPLPPKIHDLVYRCESDEVFAFSGSLDFLPLLLSSSLGSPDDVAASFLRQASLSHPEPSEFLLGAGRELAALLGGELQRLNGLLRRLTP